jgi:hypothetical protein
LEIRNTVRLRDIPWLQLHSVDDNKTKDDTHRGNRNFQHKIFVCCAAEKSPITSEQIHIAPVLPQITIECSSLFCPNVIKADDMTDNVENPPVELTIYSGQTCVVIFLSEYVRNSLGYNTF